MATIRLDRLGADRGRERPGERSAGGDRFGRLGEGPSTASVALAAAAFAPALACRLGATLAGDLPPVADPSAERVALDRLSADLAA